MREYTVERADAPPLSGDVAGTPWERADTAEIDRFPWYESGRKQATTARALYDDDALYLQYQAEDAHSYAEATELNGPVWEDSAVEFFARPDLEDRRHFNFEANCVGTHLVGWGLHRDLEFVPEELGDRFRVETSVEGPTKEESPDDESWWLAARLPFDALSAFTGLAIDPGAGTEWRANFHRCGGKTDPQAAMWNARDTPERDFHDVDHFGRLTFA